MSEDNKTAPTKPHPAMLWAGRIITALVGITFLMSGVMKFKGGKEMSEELARIGLPESIVVPLAILEITCVVIYLIPPTSIIGAILLTGYMGGAICTHWRVGDPFIAHIVIGVLVWLGVYLRDGRLRKLIPIRQSCDKI